MQQITGGVRAGGKENERLIQAQDAAGAAKKYATEQYGIDFSTLDEAFCRVLASLMDLSGTEEARKKNADLYKDYMNTRKDIDGGTYWKIVTDFLAMDLSLFERRDPKFMIDHHNEIFGACEVGSEMFQNVLPKMKEDTGVEPDEDTMNNINALTSFLMDITIINTGYWDMLGSEGLDFMDLDRIDDFDSILEENYGGADDSSNAATGEVQGKADTLDNRVDKFDRDFSGDYTNMKVEQTLGGLSNIKRYKVATSKSSVKEILRNMYGWKDLKNGPRKKGEKGLAK